MADYEANPQVHETDQIRLYGKRYRIKGKVRVSQATQWPAKLAIGDYSANDDPLLSHYTVADLRGGMGVYRYHDLQGQLDRFWDSFGCDTLNANAITLAPAVPSIGRPQDTTLGTTDTGATWTPTAVGAGVTLRAIAAFDANNAWMVGDSGVIAKTTDGGTTWAAQTSGITTNLVAAAAASANVAWAVTRTSGTTGAILATTDGGATWSVQQSIVVDTITVLIGMAAASTSVAWVTGGSGTVYKTTNGGTTWTTQTTSNTFDGTAIAAASATVAWLTKTNGEICATTNGGTNWTTQTSGVATQLNAVAAFDANNAWAVGVSGTVLNTVNGGATWTNRTAALGIATTLYGVVALSATTAVVVGAGGVIKKTVDNGVNWTTPASGTTGDQLAIAKGSGTVAWTAGVTSVPNLSGVVGALNNTPVAAYGTKLYEYTGGMWTGLIDTLTAAPVGNPVVFGGKLYYPLGASGYSYQSTPGGSLTHVATPTVQSFTLWDDKLFGLDTAFVLYSSTTGGAASWTTLATINLDTTFTTTYGQLLVYLDSGADATIWALTHQGPYVYDATNVKWYRSNFQFPYNNVGAQIAYGATYRGALYLLTSPTELAKLSLSLYLVAEDVSPNHPDGYGTAFAGGTVGNWVADDQHLFLLFSSPTQNFVLVWNDRGWHPIFAGDGTTSHPTKGIMVLGTTLYWSDYVETSSVGYVVRSMDLSSLSGLRANPLVSTTRRYQTSGNLELPFFDSGYAAQVKTAVQYRIKVQGLTTANETVRVDYSTDFGTTYTQLGSTITSATSGISGGAGEVTLKFGTNNVGLAFNTIRFKWTLTSGGSTAAPKIEYGSLDFYKNPDILRGFLVQLDCTEEIDNRTPRQQVDDLWTAIGTATLGTFAYRDDGGNTRSYLVKVLRPDGQEDTGYMEGGLYNVYLPSFSSNGS